MFKKLFGSNQENTFESRVERLAKMEPLQRFAAASGYKNQFFAVLCPAVAGCAANAIIAVFTDDQLPALTKAKDSMRDEIICDLSAFLGWWFLETYRTRYHPDDDAFDHFDVAYGSLYRPSKRAASDIQRIADIEYDFFSAEQSSAVIETIYLMVGLSRTRVTLSGRSLLEVGYSNVDPAAEMRVFTHLTDPYDEVEEAMIRAGRLRRG